MNEFSNNGPAPSRFVFLSELPSLPAATKVRFLGCVVGYDTLNGRLLLEHAYPKNKQPAPRASVDINLILETTPSSTLEKGRWLNIIGYIQNTHGHSRRLKARLACSTDPVVSVQAILLWDAGPLRLADYEATLQGQSQLRKQLELDCK
ncbi:hypothetical protein HRR83_008830 [Exophiala dermatitidis]|uniref:CST complex subunit Ten1 n=2 Tax=Exophiala dermatitidis TaxID=5970 RepID=H6BXF4_EXODN|nr:uncharacterized protein HMPREF1120_03524 [Exophiala dermatitidis NIH/UT8656]KAJ4503688.1 hypothetical protein HRR73_008993 [Exophiala dermatitidis]EHY55385.1 hypothetical protein HMPREF1120_03524 [Exophiala dermatitidis NIH/UT8656]KAJ4506263.1 hypothetical protein HRR75_007118 [Exophiala dermatitidis]KAJ4508358.1 hypothetical protein HRR74_007757 [Exophiala dermatitidis]KAJ4533424.1 hypothetical protein HRR77_008586 [Exophiala dermatitidis]